MKTSGFILSCLSLLVFPLADNMFADNDCKSCKAFSSGEFAREISEELNLSEKQSAQVKLILDQNAMQISQKRSDLELPIAAIRKEIGNKNPNLQNLKALILQKAYILADMEYSSIERDLKIRALLSEKQLEEWRDHFQYSSQAMGRRSERGDEGEKTSWQEKASKRHERHLTGIMSKIQSELKLTEAQQKEIQNILQKSFTKMMEERVRLHNNFSAIREELLQEKPDLKKIDLGIKEKAQILSNMEYISMERDFQLLDQLSKEQAESWQQTVRRRFIHSQRQAPSMPFMLIRGDDD